ncbi:MAG: hypothetical protein ACI9W6_002049 [Motiliproteus sp.]|jgi:hypothetical protein
MEDDKKGLPVAGTAEPHLSGPVGRRKFLLNSAKIAVPAVIVLSARGAWGGPRLCLSANGTALDSVNNTTASSVSCEDTTITLSGFSPGKLMLWPGIWPSDLESGVDSTMVRNNNGHLRSRVSLVDAVASVLPTASNISDLLAKFSFSGGVATALSGVTSSLSIYESLADPSAKSVTGFERQIIAAALNACGLSDGSSFIYSETQLDSLVANFLTLGRVPDELVYSLPADKRGNVIDGRSFLQAYFESLWN